MVNPVANAPAAQGPPSGAWGPALSAILDAQASSANLLDAVHICRSAEQLVSFARSCGSPVLAPASPMAHRLVGAALLLSGGDLRATDEGSVPVGEDVLVVEAVVAGLAALDSLSEIMAARGAASVRRAALRVLGAAPAGVHELWPAASALRLAPR